MATRIIFLEELASNAQKKTVERLSFPWHVSEPLILERKGTKGHHFCLFLEARAMRCFVFFVVEIWRKIEKAAACYVVQVYTQKAFNFIANKGP